MRNDRKNKSLKKIYTNCFYNFFHTTLVFPLVDPVQQNRNTKNICAKNVIKTIIYLEHHWYYEKKIRHVVMESSSQVLIIRSLTSFGFYLAWKGFWLTESMCCFNIKLQVQWETLENLFRFVLFFDLI